MSEPPVQSPTSPLDSPLFAAPGPLPRAGTPTATTRLLYADVRQGYRVDAILAAESPGGELVRVPIPGELLDLIAPGAAPIVTSVVVTAPARIGVRFVDGELLVEVSGLLDEPVGLTISLVAPPR